MGFFYHWFHDWLMSFFLNIIAKVTKLAQFTRDFPGFSMGSGILTLFGKLEQLVTLKFVVC